MEQIGNVELDETYYTGEDSYSDGDVEDEILDIVKNHTKEEYNAIICEKKEWPFLYHLSKIRENILNWYPIENTAEILEIGAGCGAITGILCDKAKTVTAIDLSKKRSVINAYKNKQYGNLRIIVGNFNDIAIGLNQQFDYITLIGVYEYAKSYISSEHAEDVFLQKIANLLKPNGKIIIAIENQLGLKYFAGCKEDHVGKYFEGIEGYPTTEGVTTYSKRQLSEILSRNSFKIQEFYYPYPDYKLPAKIYSDSYMPQKGELYTNIRNFDDERLVLFDEGKVFDTLIEAGLFSEFSNSFLVFASRE